MMKPLKKCHPVKKPKLGKFTHHTHRFVRFIWEEIIRRELNLTSVADAAGTDRSTLHKWRKSQKGPYISQVEEVLTVLGYEIKLVKKGEADDNT